jgi:hypothetical protein
MGNLVKRRWHGDEFCRFCNHKEIMDRSLVVMLQGLFGIVASSAFNFNRMP